MGQMMPSVWWTPFDLWLVANKCELDKIIKRLDRLERRIDLVCCLS